MKKLFISQPMNGLTDEEILNTRQNILNEVKSKVDDEIILIDSFITEEPKSKNIPLWYLAKSIEVLSEADIAYFGKGWQDARGCLIEYECAKNYGVKIILSEFDPHKTVIGKRIDAGLWD